VWTYRREACLYSGTSYNNIIPKNGKIKLRLMHNYVMEFLNSYQCETDINEIKKLGKI